MTVPAKCRNQQKACGLHRLVEWCTVAQTWRRLCTGSVSRLGLTLRTPILSRHLFTVIHSLPMLSDIDLIDCNVDMAAFNDTYIFVTDNKIPSNRYRTLHLHTAYATSLGIYYIPVTEQFFSNSADISKQTFIFLTQIKFSSRRWFEQWKRRVR